MDFTHESLPGRVVFGVGRRRELGDELQSLEAERVVFISGTRNGALVEELRAGLDIPSETILGVRPHVPETDADDASIAVDDFFADTVVSIGGGSATGLAKMVARHSDINVVAIPTTYAGSEMTPIWGTTVDGAKRTGRSLSVLPKVVIYDPELTVGLPASVTVNSAFNALAHCAEALWLPTSSPVSITDAIEGVDAILASLERAVDAPDDLEARGRLLYGAYRAGMAVATAGTGALHTTAHVLGGRYGLDHGALYAVLTPRFLEWQRDVVDPDLRENLDRAFGTEPDRLGTIARRLNAPGSLSEIGLPDGAAGEVAVEVARRTGVHPDTLRYLIQ